MFDIFGLERQIPHRVRWNWITCSRDFKVEDGGDFAEWNHAGEIMFVSYLGYEGGNHGKDSFKRLSIQSMKLSECIVVFRI